MSGNQAGTEKSGLLALSSQMLAVSRDHHMVISNALNLPSEKDELGKVPVSQNPLDDVQNCIKQAIEEIAQANRLFISGIREKL